MNDVADDDARYVQRITGLIATAGLPAVVLGAVADFFAPVGGWLWALALGVLGIGIAVYLLAALSQRDTNAPTWWMRLSQRDKNIRWIWRDRPAYKCHGVHMVVVFSAVCLYWAATSFEHREAGGVLAEKVDMLSVAQSSLGIQRAALVENQKTNEHLEEIKANMTQLAREVSEDPAKEIERLTGRWSRAGLSEAVRDDNVRVVQLYLASGMLPRGDTLASIFSKTDPQLRQLLIAYGTQFDADSCRSLLHHISRQETVQPPELGPEMVRALCRHDAARALAQSKVAQARQAMAAHQAQQAQRPSAAACRQQFARNNYQTLREDAQTYAVTRLAPPDAQALWQAVAEAPRQDEQHLAALVRAHCDAQAAPKPYNENWGISLSQWQTIARWVQ